MTGTVIMSLRGYYWEGMLIPNPEVPRSSLTMCSTFSAISNSHEVIRLITCTKRTYPTPMRYLGFSSGSTSVHKVTILQNSSFSSPPLKPPIAKPGTSLLTISEMNQSIITHDAFRLTETEWETDKMATVPNGISVSVQYEHLHTVLCKPFFIGLVLC